MATKHQRLARLLEMLTLIQHNKSLRPNDLAAYFDVSTKRVFDDIAEINAAGAGIVFRDHGYKIESGMPLPMSLRLSLEELGLVLLGLQFLQSQGGVQPVPIKRIAAKLAGMTQHEGGDCSEVLDLEQLCQRVNVEHDDTAESLPPDLFGELLCCALLGCRVRLTYIAEHTARAREEVFVPLRLYYEHRKWYLQARREENGQECELPLARILTLQALAAQPPVSETCGEVDAQPSVEQPRHDDRLAG